MVLDLLFYDKHEDSFLGVIFGWLEAELQHPVWSPGLRPTLGHDGQPLQLSQCVLCRSLPLGLRGHCLCSACMNLLRSVDELVRIKKAAGCQWHMAPLTFLILQSLCCSGQDLVWHLRIDKISQVVWYQQFKKYLHSKRARADNIVSLMPNQGYSSPCFSHTVFFVKH